MVRVTQKRVGRPPTGISPAVAVRLDPEELVRVEQFANANGISRSQALRRLIRQGLSRRLLAEKEFQQVGPRRRRPLPR